MIDGKILSCCHNIFSYKMLHLLETKECLYDKTLYDVLIINIIRCLPFGLKIVYVGNDREMKGKNFIFSCMRCA